MSRRAVLTVYTALICADLSSMAQAGNEARHLAFCMPMALVLPILSEVAPKSCITYI